jgi:hypothetical protein
MEPFGLFEQKPVGMAVTIMVGINIRHGAYNGYGAGAIRDVVSDQITGFRGLNRRTRTIMSKRSQKCRKSLFFFMRA